ncbi:MerR family transcriptional regulator [Ectobacillus funiculus]|uniref:MerR family transcriptional regulator n=1 Tax=Ectobacillus funiculus TaxID=137993 RepID=A0ABV5WGW0_9BACI
MSYGYFAKEVIERLQIKSSTLRNWCKVLEESNINFERNDRDQRIFFESDIALLEKMKFLLQEEGKTLKEAVETLATERDSGAMALSAIENSNTTLAPPERHDGANVQAFMNHMENISKQIASTLQQQEIVVRQNESILNILEREKEEKEELKRENEMLQTKLDQILDSVQKIEKKQEKRSLFEILFTKKND